MHSSKLKIICDYTAHSPLTYLVYR